MLSRKEIKTILLESLLIVLLIYIGIFLLTDILDSQRVQQTEQDIAESNLRQDRNLVSQKFYNTFATETCNISKTNILEEFEKREGLSSDINRYIMRGLSRNLESYSVVRRRFFLNQLTLLNQVKKHNNNCEDKIYPIIHFINGEIETMNRQGLIIEQFYEEQNDVVSFVFDINFEDEEIITKLKNHYNVTTTPYIIAGETTTDEFNESIVSLQSLRKDYTVFMRD